MVEFKVEKNKQLCRVQLCFDTAKLLGGVKLTKYGIYTVSLEDLAAAKLQALVERLEDRDIVDFYFICKKIPLEKAIRFAKMRWGYIDEYEVAVKFTKVEFIINKETPVFEMLTKKVSVFEIKEFYTKEAVKILEKIKK